MDELFVVVAIAAAALGLAALTRVRPRPLPRFESSIQAEENEARRWIEKLGASLPPPRASASCVEALRCYELARAQFMRAGTPYQYAVAGRTAIDGLSRLPAASPEAPSLVGHA